MSNCKNIQKCRFFSEYRKSRHKYFGVDLALRGIIREFCQGSKQDKCIRKMLGKALGGQQYVPVNMMPQGRAIPGTDTSQWSQEVKSFVNFVRSDDTFKNL